MEVKDVNNNATIQALFAKAVAGSASGQALGSGFASLIGQVGDLVASPSKDDGARVAAADRDVADRAPAASDRVENKKDKAAKKTRPAAEKEDRPADRPNDRKRPSVDAAPVQGVQDTVPQAAASAAGDAGQDLTAAANASDAVIQPREGAEPVAREMAANLIGAEAPAVVAVMDGSEMVMLSQSGMSLSALAQMPSVNVLDNATGEVVSMTGAELAAKLQQASDAGQLFVVDENSSGKFVNLIPAEVSAEAGSRFGKGSVDAAVLPEQAAQLADEQLAAQAEMLDARLGREQKVKLDVKIEEEKISLSGDADLLRDKLAVDEAVNAVLKDKGSENRPAQVSAPLSAQPQPAQPAAANQQQAAQLVNPAAAPAAGAETRVAAEASKAAAVEGISAVNSNNSALGTAALAGNVRAEARGQSSEASFRDIYKGISKEVIDQVKVNITKSAVKGVDNIDIQLKPEDLGHIQIKMQISKDGRLQAHIVSSRPETMEMLQKEAQNLEKAFNDAGFQTDEGSLSFSFREGGESGREQDRNSELRSFIGNVLEHDVENELAGNDNLPDWNPAQGLNIRV